MEDPTHHRVMDILADALELPAEQREAFVRRACGDDAACRDEVQRLLDAEHVARPMPTLHPPKMISRSLAAPDHIGPYRIVRELGRGGMGVVYLAQQERPVRRQVAIKVIQLGMNSAEVEARFDSERQALAVMNHPNVARVFDGGTSETGRTYFVMEYVPGEPITDYCDKHALNTRQRLELFLQVCDAVQHSHQKGIIHRDLKPGNVLITTIDEKPVAKVIDFGIAKAVEQPLTERTFFTEHGRLMGTPEFMSPEQASMDARDIDTRTDVYSLGVLLYELISGTLPFDRELMRKSRFDEIRRLIREVDPPRPSTRLDQLGAPASEIAQKHQSAPAALVRSLRGELDWITMKAMEKEPSRRYASAAELAADVQRHLNDEPVLAGPPSTVYRMKKFVHKHRVPVGAAALVLLALIGGIVGVAWQAVAARRAEARATQRFNDVRAIANKLLFDFDHSIMYVPGTLSARRLLVTTALEYLDKIARDAADDVNLENDLANAYIGVGKIQWEHSLPNIGDRPGAIASFRKAVELSRRAVSQQPDDTRLQITLGLALARYGSAAYFAEPQHPIEAMTEALSIFQSLAQSVGDNKVIDIDMGAVMYSLGWALSDTGKVEEGFVLRQQALDHFKKLREKRPDDFDVKQWQAASSVMVGKSLLLLGRLDDAEREIRTGRQIYVDLMRIIPDSVVSRRSIAVSDSMLGDLRAEQGDFRGAAELYAQAADEVGALMTADPSDMQARMDYGMTLYRLAELQSRGGDSDGAVKTFETKFLPMVQKRYARGHATLVGYQLQYASLLRQAGRYEDAAKMLETCELEATSASSPRLAEVIREQIALFEQWDKPDLAAAAKARLSVIGPPATRSAP